MTKDPARDQFRTIVLARDNNRCVVCGEPAQDVHHIIERRLFADGGYFPANGASVCGPCHIRAEQTLISPEELREAAGITKAYLPEHLYDDAKYDKWGNEVISGGRRLQGELFEDPSVQAILKAGGVLDLFTSFVKYPRTHHLPWSPGMHDDDRVIKEMSAIENADEVIVTTKMDGENSSLYRDHIHARSIESDDHPSRHWLKNLWSRIRYDIPEGWRICGENLHAKHSIGYDGLPSFFLGFSVWNDRNVCLSWDETLEWLELLGLKHVQVFYRGKFDKNLIQRKFESLFDTEKTEGYVVRVAGEFKYREFRTHVAKWVRPKHIQTTKHWMRGSPITYNALEEKS
jgi:hypothetical protein